MKNSIICGTCSEFVLNSEVELHVMEKHFGIRE